MNTPIRNRRGFLLRLATVSASLSVKPRLALAEATEPDLNERYQEMLRLNEGGNIYALEDAYKGTAICGYSFGRKQIDLLRYEGKLSGVEILQAIEIEIRNVRNAGPVLTEKEIQDIHGLQIATMKATREQRDLVDKINTTLERPDAQKVIDDWDSRLTAADVAQAKVFFNNHFSGANSGFDTLVCKLFYLDYLNLFGSADTCLNPFIDGKDVHFPVSGRRAKIVGAPSFSNLTRFLFATLQGYDTSMPNHRPDALRRLNNTMNVASQSCSGTAAEKLKLTPEDVSYFRNEFAAAIYTPDMRKAAATANGAPCEMLDSLTA